MSWKFSQHEPELELSFGKQVLLFAWEVFKVVVISVAIIVPIRYFLIKPFYVKGASMEPNFYDKEYLIIDEISYRFQQPERGDIVVFRYPGDPGQFFIKRVIGLPGESIRIRNNTITIYNDANPQGVALSEPYLAADAQTQGNGLVIELADDAYYLLGDNRSSSLDSRAFGAVERPAIVGKVLLRGWPLQRIQLFTDSINYH